MFTQRELKRAGDIIKQIARENHVSEDQCILRSPAAAGAVTNGSPAAAAAAQFLGCSFC